MLNDFRKLACRVCGKIQGEPPWGEDGQCPNYDICDCCGVEFGYGDCTSKAARSFRDRWIAKGSVWKRPELKPSDWSLMEQLCQIPEEYK